MPIVSANEKTEVVEYVNQNRPRIGDEYEQKDRLLKELDDQITAGIDIAVDAYQSGTIKRDELVGYAKEVSLKRVLAHMESVLGKGAAYAPATSPRAGTANTNAGAEEVSAKLNAMMDKIPMELMYPLISVVGSVIFCVLWKYVRLLKGKTQMMEERLRQNAYDEVLRTRSADDRLRSRLYYRIAASLWQLTLLGYSFYYVYTQLHSTCNLMNKGRFDISRLKASKGMLWLSLACVLTPVALIIGISFTYMLRYEGKFYWVIMFGLIFASFLISNSVMYCAKWYLMSVGDYTSGGCIL